MTTAALQIEADCRICESYIGCRGRCEGAKRPCSAYQQAADHPGETDIDTGDVRPEFLPKLPNQQSRPAAVSPAAAGRDRPAGEATAAEPCEQAPCLTGQADPVITAINAFRRRHQRA